MLFLGVFIVVLLLYTIFLIVHSFIQGCRGKPTVFDRWQAEDELREERWRQQIDDMKDRMRRGRR